MPQVDLMSAYNAGENLADDDSPASNQPDITPESFFVAELDWIDRNAFIERSVNSNQEFPTPDDPIPNSESLSELKQSIINLPDPKPAKSVYAETKHRRPVRIRLFPKRSSSEVPVAEPSSPKVSCMGRVRSRRDRSRRRNTGRRKQAEPAITRSRSSKIQKKRGFWCSFRSIFKSRGSKQLKGNEIVSEPPVVAAPVADPPPLAAVKRFSSARRSDAWAADLEADAAKSDLVAVVKRFSSARRSDAWAADLEADAAKSDRPTLGAVKRFTSGRRSDAWAAELVGDVAESVASNPPTGSVKEGDRIPREEGRHIDEGGPHLGQSQAG